MDYHGLCFTYGLHNPRSVPGLRQLCQVYPHRQIVTWLTAKSSPGVVQELGTPMVPLTDLDGLDGRCFQRILEAKDSKASHLGVKPLVNSSM